MSTLRVTKPQTPVRRLTRLGNQGFTLIEAMIMAAILSITVVTFSTYSFQRARLIKANDLRRKNDQVANAIKNSAMQSESVGQTEEMVFTPGLPTPPP